MNICVQAMKARLNLSKQEGGKSKKIW